MYCVYLWVSGFILFEVLRTSCMCRLLSLNKFDKSSIIISLNIFSVLFSLSYPSGVPVMHTTNFGLSLGVVS